MQTDTPIIAKPRKPWHFTPENAREMAARALKAKRAACGYVSVENAPDPYIAGRLTRVRKQIERLSDMLDSEIDPQKLDRLAAAIERLAKQEQNLAGRPLPGSFKPIKVKASRPNSGPEADPTPQ